MNNDMTLYDKAKWHYEGDYPRDIPEENAYTHSGMFLAWLTDKNLLASTFIEDFQTEIQQLRERNITPGRLFQIVDGVLASDMLNEESNAFAKSYFNGDQYLSDYHELLAKQLPSFYHVPDTWENYDKLKERIDQRYSEWKKIQET
jgi:hypothetical protein